ncbi:hypothetical protein BSZ35_02015 [Salinibacter sp. 10B]|uniref:hypothetical protein n=1 Tax=Salinibacter sp. 10B TaxID=1923971 RepID=UPI000CF5799E|nr:hypothetical protein [Salinibacter sp. 10B]PQJ33534.1 hypothetical protein BSZ35_02015 [Salinibacter sp. 10B]
MSFHYHDYDPMTASPSDEQETNVSLFDMAADGASPADADRVQVLKRALFDLSYLIMNADGTEHISERMLVQKLERRMEQEGSVNAEARADELAPLLEKGPEAVRERVQALAAELAEQAGDRAEVLAQHYLDFLKGLIVADANVAAEEYELFDLLCEEWGIEKDLPRS